MSQVRRLAIVIRQSEEQRDELEEIVKQTQSAGYDRIGSKSADDSEHTKVKLLNVKRDINGRIADYVETKDHIIREIQMLDNPRHVELLHLRYIDFMRLEEIACVMRKTNGAPYSYDHIRAMHVQALKAFETRFPEKF